MVVLPPKLPFTLEAPVALRRRVRRGLAVVLRTVADLLRDDDLTVASGTVSTGPHEAAPAPAPGGPPERFGAAKLVDEADERAEEAPTADAAPEAEEAFDLSLLDGLSGDVGPAIASRQEAAKEQSSGGTPEATAEVRALHDQIVAAIHTVYDPEIPVDIYELGLIYGVDIDPDRFVNVRMTLTSPNCPAAQSLPSEVRHKVEAVDGVEHADVEVVFDPPWTPDLMSEEAKLELNIA